MRSSSGPVPDDPKMTALAAQTVPSTLQGVSLSQFDRMLMHVEEAVSRA
jgi:hypothetical protein